MDVFSVTLTCRACQADNVIEVQTSADYPSCCPSCGDVWSFDSLDEAVTYQRQQRSA